jgi:paraquat-inducible protein A
MVPWAMMEVYMLSVLVAIVKLSELATIVPGIALYAFSALILVTAWSGATLDPRIVWDRAAVAGVRRPA